MPIRPIKVGLSPCSLYALGNQQRLRDSCHRTNCTKCLPRGGMGPDLSWAGVLPPSQWDKCSYTCLLQPDCPSFFWRSLPLLASTSRAGSLVQDGRSGCRRINLGSLRGCLRGTGSKFPMSLSQEPSQSYLHKSFVCLAWGKNALYCQHQSEYGRKVCGKNSGTSSVSCCKL